MSRRGYKPGRKARKMYSHYESYGTAGMSKRQLRALAREMDLINPGRSKKRKSLEAKYKRATRLSARHHGGITSFKNRRRKKWLGKQARALRQLRRIRRNPIRDDFLENVVGGALGNPRRRNPKRDGTATRGEMRAVKREAWLRTVIQRGKDAEAILHRVHSVPASAPAAVKEHVPEAAREAAAAPAAVVEQVIAPAVEHAEAAMIRSRISDLNELIADLERDIEKADAAGEDAEAEDLMEQKVKLVRQKKVLKDKADGLGISLTNPRRRNPGRGRWSSRSSRHVLVGLKAYGRALKAYHSAMRAGRRSR